jgi:hypothetical protein
MHVQIGCDMTFTTVGWGLCYRSPRAPYPSISQPRATLCPATSVPHQASQALANAPLHIIMTVHLHGVFVLRRKLKCRSNKEALSLLQPIHDNRHSPRSPIGIRKYPRRDGSSVTCLEGKDTLLELGVMYLFVWANLRSTVRHRFNQRLVV